MNNVVSLQADHSRQLTDLSAIAQRLLEQAKMSGASQAETSCHLSQGLNVSVRMGAVDTIESTRDRGVVVTVYFADRKGSASTSDFSDAALAATVAQACAIAKYTESDPASGLADAASMATAFPDFDLWHPWNIEPDAAIGVALEAEAAGREADSRITNSDGAALGTEAMLSVYANSHGFLGQERKTHHSVSCALIAGQNETMQSDGWYSLAVAPDDLERPGDIGRRAAERTVARLAPRRVATGEYPVLFQAPMARSLIGHLIAGISGGALYRRASFLLDTIGEPLFPDWFGIDERPHRPRGLRSEAFDAEGVATRDSALVEKGVLCRYVLSSYSARKLGLVTTANAGGISNLFVLTRGEHYDDLISGMESGLIVTQLMGQGVNPLTGDYSRGASGFWVENGAIAWPVDEVTIAGNLRDMFKCIEAVGHDVDPRSHVHTGSILVGNMMIAGQ